MCGWGDVTSGGCWVRWGNALRRYRIVQFGGVGAKDSGARRCEAVAMTSEVVRGFVEAER